MTSDEQKVFQIIINCEISLYTQTYTLNRAVVSAGDIAKILSWTKYRVRKAIKNLVHDGLIKRDSVGCPAVESVGEYRELIFEARPPMNGYSITKRGFESTEWKETYNEWEESMKEWANGGGE